MKNYINGLMGLLVVLCTFSFQPMDGAQSSDIAIQRALILEDIKKQSNLTQKDLTKWFSLVRFGSWIGTKGSALLIPIMATVGYTVAPELVGGILTDVSSYIFSGENLWKTGGLVAAPVLASLYLSYKLFYPRTQKAICEKLKKFDDLCQRAGLGMNPPLGDKEQNMVRIVLVGNSDLVAFRMVLENLSAQNRIASLLLPTIDGKSCGIPDYLSNRFYRYAANIIDISDHMQQNLGVIAKEALEAESAVLELEKKQVEIAERKANVKKKEEENRMTFTKRMLAIGGAAKNTVGAVGNLITFGASGVKNTVGAVGSLISYGASGVANTAKFVEDYGLKAIGTGFLLYGALSVLSQQGYFYLHTGKVNPQ